MESAQGIIRHPGRRGRPRRRPRAVCGDKGYTSRAIRAKLRAKGIRAIIPRLSNEKKRGTRFDRTTYRQRNVVERAFNRLKRFRRVATRYEKRADTYRAMLVIACCLEWL